MGNLGDCNCKCKDNKQEGEMNLPTTKTNLNDIQNQELSNKNKNLNDLFKKNQITIKEDEDNDEYMNSISEIKLNDFDKQNNNFNKTKGENEKRTRENSIRKKKEDLINTLENYYNLNNSNQNKENINTNKKNENDNNSENLGIKTAKSEKNSLMKKTNIFESKNNNQGILINNKKSESGKKIDFFFDKNKTFVGKHTPVIFKNKLNNKVELDKTNSTNEKNQSFTSQLSKFNTENCKEFLEKYHLICSHLIINIPIKEIIKNPNLLHKDKSNQVLFYSELNRVQFFGGRVISKKYIGRFFSSTKNEINIYASREKYITLQNPLQTFLYKNMNKSCFVEFDLGKKNNQHLTPTFKKKKDNYHFMIYFKNETFEILSSDNEELIGKWITLINYLIDDLNKNELNNDQDDAI